MSNEERRLTLDDMKALRLIYDRSHEGFYTQVGSKRDRPTKKVIEKSGLPFIPVSRLVKLSEMGLIEAASVNISTWTGAGERLVGGSYTQAVPTADGRRVAIWGPEEDELEAFPVLPSDCCPHPKWGGLPT